MKIKVIAICLLVMKLTAAGYVAPTYADAKAISKDLQKLKSEVITLNRELRVLEEKLLFPSSTRFSVFVSARSGQFFKLESVKLKIAGKLVASHIYPNSERQALLNGGTQRLFVTNMAAGSHQVTAFFTGTDQNGRPIKRAKSVLVDKGESSAFLEIQVGDAPSKQEPVFELKQW